MCADPVERQEFSTGDCMWSLLMSITQQGFYEVYSIMVRSPFIWIFTWRNNRLWLSIIYQHANCPPEAIAAICIHSSAHITGFPLNAERKHKSSSPLEGFFLFCVQKSSAFMKLVRHADCVTNISAVLRVKIARPGHSSDKSAWLRFAMQSCSRCV